MALRKAEDEPGLDAREVAGGLDNVAMGLRSDKVGDLAGYRATVVDGLYAIADAVHRLADAIERPGR